MAPSRPFEDLKARPSFIPYTPVYHQVKAPGYPLDHQPKSAIISLSNAVKKPYRATDRKGAIEPWVNYPEPLPPYHESLEQILEEASSTDENWRHTVLSSESKAETVMIKRRGHVWKDTTFKAGSQTIVSHKPHEKRDLRGSKPLENSTYLFYDDHDSQHQQQLDSARDSKPQISLEEPFKPVYRVAPSCVPQSVQHVNKHASLKADICFHDFSDIASETESGYASDEPQYDTDSEYQHDSSCDR